MPGVPLARAAAPARASNERRRLGGDRLPTMRAGALDVPVLAQGSFRNAGPGERHVPQELPGRIDRVRGGSDPGRVTNLVCVRHAVNISADRLS